MLDADAATPPSFQTLVAEHLPTLRRRAVRLTRSRQDADDIVQDALVRALRDHAQLRSAATARGWLLTIVSSTFLDQVRRRRVRPSEVPIAHEPAVAESDAEAPWCRLSIDDVRAAAAGLPDDVRDAYRLFAFEGRDYATIAGLLGIPKGTVGSRVLRARRMLRARLSPVTDR
jgi:RNA polymerase sigma-70 factor (ECF subfamily)